MILFKAMDMCHSSYIWKKREKERNTLIGLRTYIPGVTICQEIKKAEDPTQLFIVWPVVN